MANFTVDLTEIDRVSQAFMKFSDQAEKVVEEVLPKEGYEEIAKDIAPMIHPSGRDKSRWKNKATASSSSPTSIFRQEMVGRLTLYVKTYPRFGYLYFPDDGSNTVHHCGNQDFMYKGAEQATEEVANKILDRLVQAFEEA